MVQVTALPAVTEAGEQVTLVDVGGVAFQSSGPVVPSLAERNIVSPTVAKLPLPKYLTELPAPGRMSLTSTVPAVEPSDCHSS